MKYTKVKYIRLFAMILIALTMMSFVKQPIVKSKTLTETFVVNPATHMVVKNDCGSIEFKNTDDDEARIEATIKVEGKTEEEIAKVLEQFMIDLNIAGNDINVKADNNVDQWVRYNGLLFNRNTITFHDGTKAEDIADTDISLVIYLPKLKELSIYNKYDKVSFESFNCDVNAVLMSSDMSGGAINGDIDIDLKYGELNIGDVQGGKLVLFDSDIVIGNGGDMVLNSKYSSLKFENVASLDQLSFDDEMVLKKVTGDVAINAKYSEFNFEDFGDGELTTFSCELEAGKGSSVSLNSKYSTFVFDDVAVIDLQSFDDHFTFGDVEKLNISNSKYTDYQIDKIDQEMIVHSSFEDDIDVDIVSTDISKVTLDSKYTDLHFPIPSEVSYHLNALVRYCSFDYPENSEIKTKLKKGESFELVCKVNSPAVNGTKVSINAYSGEIDIK